MDLPNRRLEGPAKIGSGARLKILEAFAAGTLVISSGIGAEDLEAEQGRHCLLAESAEEFVEQVVFALNYTGTAEAMLRQAKTLFRDRYDWPIIARKLDRVWSGD